MCSKVKNKTASRCNGSSQPLKYGKCWQNVSTRIKRWSATCTSTTIITIIIIISSSSSSSSGNSWRASLHWRQSDNPVSKPNCRVVAWTAQFSWAAVHRVLVVCMQMLRLYRHRSASCHRPPVTVFLRRTNCCAPERPPLTRLSWPQFVLGGLLLCMSSPMCSRIF